MTIHDVDPKSDRSGWTIDDHLKLGEKWRRWNMAGHFILVFFLQVFKDQRTYDWNIDAKLTHDSFAVTKKYVVFLSVQTLGPRRETKWWTTFAVGWVGGLYKTDPPGRISTPGDLAKCRCRMRWHVFWGHGIVGCTPTNVPCHGKSLYKPYIVGIYGL